MSISKRLPIFIALIVGSMVLIAACGGSDSDSVSSSESASSSGGGSIVSAATELESEAVGDEVATPEPEHQPPAVSVVALEVPEAGSEEAEVFAALDRYVTSINTQDWPAFQAQCSTGNSRNVTSIDKITFAFEEAGGFFKYDIPDFAIYGFNGRAVEFRIYSADNARATFDLYDYDKWLATGVSRTFKKVDGVWMSDSYECYPG